MSNQHLKLKIFNKSVLALLVVCTYGMISNVHSAPVKSSLKTKQLKRVSSVVEVLAVVAPNNPKKERFEVLTHSDNRVFSISSKEIELIQTLQAAAAEKKPLRLVMRGTEIVSASSLDEKAMAEYEIENPRVNYAFEGREDNQTYTPTILNSDAEAHALFNNVSEMASGSQCYMRAHLWAYKWSRTRQVNSMKVFLFFTNKFRNENKSWGKPYKWWFHVAPFVYVRKPDGSLKEVVLDRQFLDGPVEMQAWTDAFMKTDKVPNPDKCVDLPQYTQDSYFSNPWYNHCLLRKEPMYVMQPNDAEAYDKRAVSITNFREIDLDLASRAVCSWIEVKTGSCKLSKKLNM